MHGKICIRRLEQTAYACPSTWRGQTDDKKNVRIRYQAGLLTVDVESTPGTWINVVSETVGYPQDGVMDCAEMQWRTADWVDFVVRGCNAR